jgi:hypothetical protein
MDMNSTVDPDFSDPDFSDPDFSDPDFSDPDFSEPGVRQPAGIGASGRGAGQLGFTGTAPKTTSTTTAAGLIERGAATDSMDGTRTMPMLPTTWGTDPEHTPAPDESGPPGERGAST